jgi:hypothetical protein
LFAVTTYALPDKLRPTLSRPLGELISGSNIDLGKVLRKLIQQEKPTKVILVGDNVSRRASEAGIRPDVMIIDKLEKRHRAIDYAYPSSRKIKAKNQAGRIEHNAWVAVQRAISGEADLIEIDGEEDLLVLTAVLVAPIGSLVVYGQPNEGIVLVRVSAERKAGAERILGQMERVGLN